MDNLKFINEQMGVIAVPYEFGEWTSPVSYPYGVGEITEEPITTEDGAEQSMLFLTFFHRGKMIDLLAIKNKIKKHFPPIHGLRGETEDGAIAVFYDSFLANIPTGEAGLKKIQVNLKILEWKGAVS